jgi:hypothetical protein
MLQMSTEVHDGRRLHGKIQAVPVILALFQLYKKMQKSGASKLFIFLFKTPKLMLK